MQSRQDADRANPTGSSRRSRREFLGKAAVAGGAAGAVAAVGAVTDHDVPAASNGADAAEPRADAGYRETPHIRRYYELARS